VGGGDIQDLNRAREIQQEDAAGRRRESGKTGVQGGQKAQGNNFELVNQPGNNGDGQDVDHDGNHDRDQCNNSATGTCRAVEVRGTYLYGCDIERLETKGVFDDICTRCESVPLFFRLVSLR
jgi:hypothetical protein